MNRNYLSISLITLALILSIGVVAIVIGVESSQAEGRRRFPPLNQGMDYESVLALRGPPEDKVERETKREVVWRYGYDLVVFRNGLVVLGNRDATSKGNNPKVIKVKKDLKEKVQSSSRRNTHKISSEMFEDIMRAVPSDNSPTTPNNPPPRPGFIPPAPPPNPAMNYAMPPVTGDN